MNKKVLLYSGGMDSWLIDKLWNPDIKLYVDLNSSYSKEEISRLPKDVLVEELDLRKWERADKIIPLRNLFLIAIASNFGNEICLGATKGDRVLDKSYLFDEKYEDLLNYLYQEQHWTKKRDIKINLSFKKFTKTQLLQKYIEKGGNIDEAFNSSFSCYNPQENKECWNCKPCFRKFISFYLNNYPFNKEIITKNINYIKKEILPKINKGSYGRKEEEEEILKVLSIYQQ